MESSTPSPETNASAQSAGAPSLYAHGYASAMTAQLHASRTAQTHAAFFLPYLRPGMHLLDCGCGSGGITVGFARAVAPGEATGIDIAASEIEHATARAAAEGVANVRFAVERVEAPPYADGTFDAVFAHNVLEHLPDPTLALREMARMLKPGGCIGVRDIDFGGHLLAATDPRIEQFHQIFEHDWRQVGGHPRIGRRLRSYLHAAGFVDIRANASYEAYGTPDALRRWSAIIVSHCSEPDFVARVTGSGLMTPEALEQVREAYTEWAEQPDSFWALAHCEVVAYKPREGV